MERENRNLTIIWIHLRLEKGKMVIIILVIYKINNPTIKSIIFLIHHLKRNKTTTIKKKSDLRVHALPVNIQKIITFFNEWNIFYFSTEISKVEILRKKLIPRIKTFEFILICRTILTSQSQHQSETKVTLNAILTLLCGKM